MTIVLDTTDHPPNERADLVHEVIAGRGVPTDVTLHDAGGAVDLRMETWELGSVHVLRTSGTGLRMRRTRRHLRGGVPELFAVSLALQPSVHTACGVTQRYERYDCHLNDLTGTTDIAHMGSRGGSLIVHLSCDQVGISVDTVRAALPRLAASPLLPLVRAHLRQLDHGLDAMAVDPVVAASVGSATIELARALVVSAADDRAETEVLHETLETRIVAYAHRHLGDPDLSAAQIARAHHISLRTLYNTWSNPELTLMEWIVRERLAAAERELRASSASPATVSTVARRWGFRDPAHFARRFRGVYGLSPREWRYFKST